MEAVKELQLSKIISEMASKALADCDGDIQQAAKAMVRALHSDPAVFTLFVDKAVETACAVHVRLALSGARNRIFNQAEPDKGGRGHRLTGGMLEYSLLMFPLPGGVALGKATKEEVIKAADFYRSHESDARHKKRWLNLISIKVPGGKHVEDVLTHNQLLALQKKAEGA